MSDDKRDLTQDEHDLMIRALIDFREKIADIPDAMSDAPKRELLPGEAEVDAWIDTLERRADAMSDETEKLLPCPFCAESVAEIMSYREPPSEKTYYRVRCEECWAQSHGSYHLSPRGAAKVWNTRLTEPEG